MSDKIHVCLKISVTYGIHREMELNTRRKNGLGYLCILRHMLLCSCDCGRARTSHTSRRAFVLFHFTLELRVSHVYMSLEHYCFATPHY